MVFTATEQQAWDDAIKFAKANKKCVGSRLTPTDVYLPEEEPVSVFVSGSPGAGKTEASVALVNLFTSG